MFLHPGVIGPVAGLVVIGLWQLTSGSGGSTDALDAGPRAPAVVLPSPEEISLDRRWSRVDLPGRSRLRNVWEVGGTLFAPGWDGSARRTVVWTSPDGAIWRQVVADEGQFDDAAVDDMFGFDGLVIAVGSRRIDDHPVLPGIVVPAVWRSFDGEAFSLEDALEVQAVPGDGGEPTITTASGGFTSAEVFGEGLLVGGWQGPADPLTGNGDTRPGMWRTVDTIRFTPSGVGVDDDTPGIIRALTTDGQSFVAAGASNGTATIWTIADGVEWIRTIADGDIGSSGVAATPTLSGALILGRGVVGEGETVSDTLRLWSSGSSGLTTMQPTGLDRAQLLDVAVGGVGVVAVGAVTLNDGSTSGALWHRSRARSGSGSRSRLFREVRRSDLWWWESECWWPSGNFTTSLRSGSGCSTRIKK